MSARQLCAVKGRILPGALCGSVIVGMTECGLPLGRCKHQRPPPPWGADCKPGSGCARQRAGLGGCPAGYCNPPSAPAPAPQMGRECIACGSRVLSHQSEVCPHESA